MSQVKTFDVRDCVHYIHHLGSDATIVNAARVSLAKSIDETKDLSRQDIKLIDYLADNDHSSPFFHVIVSFRIKMPIFVAREWFRHTVGFARNEESRRYITSPVECMLPTKIREKHPNRKQGSLESEIDDSDSATAIIQKSMEESIKMYEKLIEMKVAPEIARTVLPQSMMTQFIETASLHAYSRLYKLRNSVHAQNEIKEYAIAIGDTLSKLYPNAWSALTIVNC